MTPAGAGPSAGSLVGSLAGDFTASVDASGAMSFPDSPIRLRWSIGADDRWRDPGRERAVRQTWVGDVPVVQTVVRVPGGDVFQRVYGVAGPTGAVVVEVENASALPAVIALFVEHARAITLDDATATIDGSVTLRSVRPPGRWAVARAERRARSQETGGPEAGSQAAGNGGGLEQRVRSGLADSGSFAPQRDRRRRLEAAFLYPLAHRATLRFVLGPTAVEGSDVGAFPPAAEVIRGWDAWLDQGLRVVLPDDALSAAVRRGLSAAVLAAGAGTSPLAVAALEDWGFDAEAEHGWSRLSMHARRRATQRSRDLGSWMAVQAAMDRSGPELLLALRSLLVHEADDVITVLAELPSGWAGAPLEVHDAPTRHGPLSYALRWHGERPALLWDAPSGVTVRVPGLDPVWSTTERRGEVLLAAPLAATRAG